MVTVDNYTIRISTNENELAQIYALRYRAYLSNGSIDENSDNSFSDAHDRSGKNLIYSVWLNSTILGSIRFCFSPLNSQGSELPEFSTYDKGISSLVSTEMLSVSGNRFVIEPEIEAPNTVVSYLLAAQFHAAFSIKAHVAFAAVREEQVKFYKRFMGFQSTGISAIYPGLLSTMTLLSSPMEGRFEKIWNRFSPEIQTAVIQANFELSSHLPFHFCPPKQQNT